MMYLLYVDSSDFLKAISDFSESGVCDRPEKQNVVLVKYYKINGAVI